ncbi:MAG TPA: phosphatidate cytidylyltransferase [Usitatibacter sp.]|nr:phosphatidate cytidylyltransferase [Usitatibacter sp.]
MLLTRVLTALVLLPVVLGMTFFASAPLWSLFALAIALGACWEWSRMCELSPGAQSLYLLASGAIGAYLWLLSMRMVPGNFAAAALTAFILAAVFWIALAPWWLARRARPSASTRAAAGWLVVWPTWFALVVLRETSPWLLLAVAALVWIADTAAYFAGKRFGKHKLAPAISPGKTWEGVVGGMAGAVVYGAVLAWVAHRWDTPISAYFVPGAGIPAIVVLVCLTALSIVGDLLESWMKRGVGMKDSSNLLPGHGGLLDRIDSLTATLPLAAFAVFLVQRSGA